MNSCDTYNVVMCLMVKLNICSWIAKELVWLESLNPEYTRRIFWNCNGMFGQFWFVLFYLFRFTEWYRWAACSLHFYSSLSNDLINIIAIHFSSFQRNFIPPKFQVSNKLPKYSPCTSSTVSLASGGRDKRGFAVHCRKSVHLVVVYWERRGKSDRQKASFKRKGPQFKHYCWFQIHLYIQRKPYVLSF